MKLKINKTYIDKLGNISISSKNKKSVKKINLTLIDNINQPLKTKPTGQNIFVMKDGMVEGVLKDSPYNPVREFTVLDKLTLIIKRTMKKFCCDKAKRLLKK